MEPTVNISVRVPYHLKVLFDSTKDIHGKNISTAANDGIFATVAEVEPILALELEIKQKEEELSEARNRLAQAILIEGERKNVENKKQSKEEKIDPFLEEIRNKKFSEHIDGILVQFRNGQTPNWDRMAPLYQFTSGKELKEWFLKKMDSEKIMM